MKRLTVVFFGLGSVGQKHLNLIQKYYPQHKIIAYRTNLGKAPFLIDQSSIKFVYNIDNAVGDVAFICNPTEFHIDTALRCVNKDMHLFIEKPLSNNIVGLDDLLTSVEQKSLFAHVAYQLRFAPNIIAFRNMLSILETNGLPFLKISFICLTDFYKWEQYRERPDHVMFELSHELDLVDYFLSQCFPLDWLVCFKNTCHAYSDRLSVKLSLDADKEKRCIEALWPHWYANTTITKTDINDGRVNQLRYFFDRINNHDYVLSSFRHQVNFCKGLINAVNQCSYNNTVQVGF